MQGNCEGGAVTPASNLAKEPRHAHRCHAREGGASSTLRPICTSAAVTAYWTARSSRTMTVECEARATRLLRQRMHDHRPRGRARVSGEQRAQILLDPGDRTPVRLLRLLELVEDGD